jgi:hypothetical protein
MPRYTKPPLEPIPLNCVRLAVEMMNAPCAPTFDTKRDKREATVDLARELFEQPVRRRR